jgi:hypothetical protein
VRNGNEGDRKADAREAIPQNPFVDAPSILNRAQNIIFRDRR